MIHLRSSTGQSPEHNAIVQRLTAQANQDGYRDQRIMVIDDSGTPGHNADRVGFRELLRLIESGRVAKVFVLDISRLGRSVPVVQQLLKTAASRKVFVVADGTPVTASDLFGVSFGTPVADCG